MCAVSIWLSTRKKTSDVLFDLFARFDVVHPFMLSAFCYVATGELVTSLVLVQEDGSVQILEAIWDVAGNSSVGGSYALICQIQSSAVLHSTGRQRYIELAIKLL